MKSKMGMLLFIVCTVLCARAEQWIDPTTNHTWYYRIVDGGVEIYNNGSAAVKPSPRGEFRIPATLGGKKVVSIGNAAFIYCGEWTGSLIIPDGVEKIGADAFFMCNGLTGVVVPPSVKEIGSHAFYASGDRSVYISDMAAWCACKFKDFSANPLSVNSGNLYLNGQLVEDLVLPKGITTIGNATFCGAKCLKRVLIPNSVATIEDYAFAWCKGLTEVDIPDGVVSIGYAAFECCCNIQSISIPASVENIGVSAFCGCSSLKEINISDRNHKYKSAPGFLFTKDGKTLVCATGNPVRIKIPDGVEIIGDKAFCGMRELKEIEMPDSVLEIGEKAFLECRMPKIQLSRNLKCIDRNAFFRCQNLSEVEIPVTVEQIGLAAFYECDNMTAFAVADGNKAYASVCGYLTSKDGTELVCAPVGLAELKIPEGILNIPNALCTYNYTVRRVEIPDSVTNIGNHAFKKCQALESVTIGRNVSAIGDEAFDFCQNLKDVAFLGDAPVVARGNPFEGVSRGCIAYVSQDASGFPPEGETWNGLVISYDKAKWQARYEQLSVALANAEKAAEEERARQERARALQKAAIEADMLRLSQAAQLEAEKMKREKEALSRPEERKRSDVLKGGIAGSQTRKGDQVHPFDMSDVFEHVGTWGESNFAITKFAGFEFGSSMYCKPGELGVSKGCGPRGEDGLYVPMDITRRAIVELEGKPLGFERVEIAYSYASRKMKSLAFSAKETRTEAWYKNAKTIFDNCISLLCNEYGMGEPKISTVAREDGQDDLSFSATSGSSRVTCLVRRRGNDELEVCLRILDETYSELANSEGDEAIANPPTESIRKWVEGFQTNPRYFKRAGEAQ